MARRKGPLLGTVARTLALTLMVLTIASRSRAVTCAEAEGWVNSYRDAWQNGTFHTPGDSGIEDREAQFHQDFKRVVLNGAQGSRNSDAIDMGDHLVPNPSPVQGKPRSEKATRAIRLGRRFWRNINITTSNLRCSPAAANAPIDYIAFDWNFMARSQAVSEAWYRPRRTFQTEIGEAAPIRGNASLQFKDELLYREVITVINDDQFFVGPPPLDQGPVASNYGYGSILVNGAPPSTGTVVEMLDSRSAAPYPQGVTNASGNYNTVDHNPVVAGSVSLRVSGNTRSCPCASNGIENVPCNATISGCGAPTVTMTGTCMVLNYTVPVWPLLAKKLRKWRDRMRRAA